VLTDYLASKCSEATTDNLMRHFGGQRVYVPRPCALHGEHPLAQALGHAEAAAFCRAVGAGHVIVPAGPHSLRERTNRMVKELLMAGHSIDDTAHSAGVHRRLVQRVRRKLRKEGVL
jgi:hypothetical protein